VEFLTINEVARMLQLSRRTVYGYVKKHGLPVIKLAGGALRVPAEEFKEWLSRQREEGMDSAKKARPR